MSLNTPPSPDSLGDRRPADGGVSGPRRSLHGRAEEEMVIWQRPTPPRPVTKHLSAGPASRSGTRPRPTTTPSIQSIENRDLPPKELRA